MPLSLRRRFIRPRESPVCSSALHHRLAAISPYYTSTAISRFMLAARPLATDAGFDYAFTVISDELGSCRLRQHFRHRISKSTGHSPGFMRH